MNFRTHLNSRCINRNVSSAGWSSPLFLSKCRVHLSKPISGNSEDAVRVSKKDMKYVITIVEQLDRAAGELVSDHPINNRLALILIDNATELILHRNYQWPGSNRNTTDFTRGS